MKTVKDYPSVLTLGVAVLVGLHWALGRWVPGLPNALVEDPNAYELYIGLAGVLALIAGFAGVAIVFALTPKIDVLERARSLGGDRLRATWVSLVATPVLASVVALTAATLALASQSEAGGWAFELAGAWTLISAGRLVWVFHLLVHLDVDHQEPTKVQALELIEDAQRHHA